jgi:DNA-binding transcriptional regulator YdaS (Cro superfamily)
MDSALSNHLKTSRGTLKRLSEQLGVNRITLWRWAKDKVPAEKVVELERETGIPRRELRPDLFDERAA